MTYMPGIRDSVRVFRISIIVLMDDPVHLLLDLNLRSLKVIRSLQKRKHVFSVAQLLNHSELKCFQMSLRKREKLTSQKCSNIFVFTTASHVIVSPVGFMKAFYRDLRRGCSMATIKSSISGIQRISAARQCVCVHNDTNLL